MYQIFRLQIWLYRDVWNTIKDKPNDLLRIDGFKIEYTNRTGREKGGVCMYISEELEYKLRTDLCQANPNYESCFIEIENKNKNVIVGVVYRAHTPINNFIKDIELIYSKINSENKYVYVMGDCNLDLLKTDIHRPIHEIVDFICLFFHASLYLQTHENHSYYSYLYWQYFDK